MLPNNMQKISTFTLFAGSLSILLTPPALLAQLPDEPDQLYSWVCLQGSDQILVEAKDDKAWKPMIEGTGWTCAEKTADVGVGTIKFTCEPINEDFLSLITVTWLNGQDEKRLMGQWTHQLATEQSMQCTLAKTELWGSFDQ